MNRLLATTALVTALAMSPAMAADNQMRDAHESAAQTTQAPHQVEFISTQNPSDWLASSLIGRAVYNQSQENLGDINDVIVDENGQVVAVLVGVGGFLGIGEKDVGVKYSALQFKVQPTTEPESTSQTESMDQGMQAESSDKDMKTESFALRDQSGKVQGKAEMQIQGGQQMSSGETPDAPGQAPGALAERDQGMAADKAMQRNRDAMAETDDTDHSNVIIVLNTTREQLEAAPAFAYLDEQDVSLANQPAKDAKSSQEKSY